MKAEGPKRNSSTLAVTVRGGCVKDGNPRAIKEGRAWLSKRLWVAAEAAGECGWPGSRAEGSRERRARRRRGRVCSAFHMGCGQ